jgi:pyruvate formate lyase activating enzyme
MIFVIFNVQRYSTHDGPGIRTVVFLKGCSLECRWCQNPEGRLRKRELFFNQETCIAGCHLCQQLNPEHVEQTSDGLIVINRSTLSDNMIEQLADICPSKAISMCGEASGVEEVRQTILRDLPFYRRSEGGITLSGGEPFAQAEFARALLETARTLSIHTAVETCLFAPWKVIADCLPLVDLFLADIKHVDENKFHSWTGGKLETVLDNFRRLVASGASVIARVPLVPDFNADRESIMRIIDFIADCGHVGEVHLLQYHTLGKNKYALLGRCYECGSKPLRRDSELLGFAQEYATQKDLVTVIGG